MERPLKNYRTMKDNELKAKFFALYWGQYVMTDLRYDGDRCIAVNINLASREYAALLLKPLSQISDEDAIEVAKMSWADTKEGRKFWTPQDGRNEINAHFDLTLHFRSHIADYLRSKGYALPFRGISVEQQIEKGWIKLTEQ